MKEINQGDAAPFLEVEGHLAEVTVELFEAYGMPLQYIGTEELCPVADRLMVASTIGFVGEKVRGALVLLAPFAIVKTWQGCLAEEVETPTLEVISDTIGEFSNMLLGRLKYCMLMRGVTVLAATPTTAVSTNITLPPPLVGACAWLRFEGSTGRFDIRLNVTFSADFAFHAEEPKDAHACAGDMMIF